MEIKLRSPRIGETIVWSFVSLMRVFIQIVAAGIYFAGFFVIAFVFLVIIEQYKGAQDVALNILYYWLLIGSITIPVAIVADAYHSSTDLQIRAAKPISSYIGDAIRGVLSADTPIARESVPIYRRHLIAAIIKDIGWIYFAGSLKAFIYALHVWPLVLVLLAITGLWFFDIVGSAVLFYMTLMVYAACHIAYWRGELIRPIRKAVRKAEDSQRKAPIYAATGDDEIIDEIKY